MMSAMLLAKLVQDVVPQMVESMAIAWPCRELCEAVMDTCACGKKETFSKMLNKALAEKVLQNAIPFNMENIFELVMPAMGQMTVCDAFLWQNHTAFTGTCNVQATEKCGWCDQGDDIPDLVAELIADQVADNILDIFLDSGLQEDFDEDHVDEWEEEFEDGDFEKNGQHHYTPEELDEIEQALLDMEEQDAKNRDRQDHTHYGPVPIPQPAPAPDASGHHHRNAGIALVIVLVLAAAGAIGFFAFRHFNNRRLAASRYTDLSMDEYMPPETA